MAPVELKYTPLDEIEKVWPSCERRCLVSLNRDECVDPCYSEGRIRDGEDKGRRVQEEAAIWARVHGQGQPQEVRECFSRGPGQTRPRISFVRTNKLDDPPHSR